MSKIFRFASNNNTFCAGSNERPLITVNGCNEPTGDRYFCPKREWPMKEKCPFKNREECDNFIMMCGKL